MLLLFSMIRLFTYSFALIYLYFLLRHLLPALPHLYLLALGGGRCGAN